MLSVSVRHNRQWISDVSPERLHDWIGQPTAVLWVDIERHGDAELALLAEQFQFHPLALEDVRNSHQRPKIDFYEGYAFVVFYHAAYRPEAGTLVLEEIEMFVGPNYVVTIHDAPISTLEDVHRRWESNIVAMHHTIATLLYSLLDALLDDYFPLLDQLSERLDALEEQVFQEFDPLLLRDAIQLKRELLTLRRIVGPQRDVINVLLRGESAILPDEALPYLQDLYDHSLRVVEMVDSYREMVSSVMDGFLSVQSNNVNVIMQRLTIINLLFLPLAVLTGFFGMNFEMIPFDNPYLLEVALAAMILLPTGLFFWLRRRGWG